MALIRTIGNFVAIFLTCVDYLRDLPSDQTLKKRTKKKFRLLYSLPSGTSRGRSYMVRFIGSIPQIGQNEWPCCYFKGKCCLYKIYRIYLKC